MAAHLVDRSHARKQSESTSRPGALSSIGRELSARTQANQPNHLAQVAESCGPATCHSVSVALYRSKTAGETETDTRRPTRPALSRHLIEAKPAGCAARTRESRSHRVRGSFILHRQTQGSRFERGWPARRHHPGWIHRTVWTLVRADPRTSRSDYVTCRGFSGRDCTGKTREATVSSLGVGRGCDDEIRRVDFTTAQQTREFS